MSADAYATAFMVMGLDKAKEFTARHPELDVYLIYSDDQGRYQTYSTPGMQQYIAQP